MDIDRLAVVLTVLTCAALGWVWRGTIRTWPLVDRLGALVLVPGLLSFWAWISAAIAGAPALDWNGARLAPTFAVAQGYALYYPATSGPILSSVYGPLAPFAFLPALICRTPTCAILCAAALSVAFVIVPLFVFAWWTRPRHSVGGLLVLVCWFGSCALMARSRAGGMWITSVHPDAAALALGLLACATVWAPDPERPPTPRRLIGVAVLAALSVAMKQVIVPLPVALGLFVWMAYGVRSCINYLWVFSLAVGVLLVFVALSCDVDAAVFNAVTIATHQPWIRPGVLGLWEVARMLLWAASVPVVLLGLAIAIDVLAGRTAGGGGRLWLRHRPWLVPAVVAVALFPSGVLGVIKVGGDHNSFYSLYFLTAALTSALVWNGSTLRRGSWRRAFRVACYLYCGANVALTWSAGRYPAWGTVVSPSVNANQQAYEFMGRHPGEAYFPWYPLATLLAEGRLDHFEYAVVDRFLAGYEPTREHIEAHLPPRMRMLVSGHKPWILRYFPDYTSETESPELAGWKVFSRPSAPVVE